MCRALAPRWMDLEHRTFKMGENDFELDKNGEQALINKWNAGSVACFLSQESRGSFKMSVEINHAIDDRILTAVLTGDASSLPKWLKLADLTFVVEETDYKSDALKDLVKQLTLDVVKTLGIQMKASVKDQDIDDETYEMLLDLQRKNFKPVDHVNFDEVPRAVAPPRPAPAPAPNPAPAPRPFPSICT